MKKIFVYILVVSMIFCVCGCKGKSDNSSSQVTVIEYQNVTVNENGDVISNTDGTSSDDRGVGANSSSGSSVDNGTSQTSKNQGSSIDYDTIVEIDICDDVVRGYLDAQGAKKQFDWLNEYSGVRCDFQNLSLDWNFDGSLEYTLYFSENADFGNSFTVKTNSMTVNNTILIPGKTYYWKVVGTLSDKALGGGRIRVKDAPVRWIKIDGASNVRDMGGWSTASGQKVKYGMLYRGQNIDNISDAGIATIKQLGLKTELDLRYERQKNQKQGTGMNYVFLDTSAQYDRIFDDAYANEVKTNYKKIFELLSNESNYPFYAHCSAGADRTGVFAFLTNGVLGVSYEDLTRDFELTSFSSSGKRWRGAGLGGTFSENDDIMQQDQSNYVAWGKLYKGMMEYGRKNGCTTLQSSIEHYLVNYIGVPQSQIDSFKRIMLG